MYPTSGPFYAQLSSGTASPKAWAWQKWRYKQVPPYNLNLPYKAYYWSNILNPYGAKYDAGTYSGSTRSPVTFENTEDPYFAYYQSWENAAVSRAISQFNSLQFARASMGVAIAETRTTISMLTKRVGQLTSFVRAIKRLDVNGAAKALGLSVFEAKKQHRVWLRAGKRGPYSLRNEDIWQQDWKTSYRGRRLSRAAADLWLEYSFGWGPLIDDVRTAVGILNDTPFYTQPLRARGYVTGTFTSQEGTSDAFWVYTYAGKHTVKAKCAVGGVLTVSNSNYQLAASLGLTNPWTVAYELTPWSFVFNYFVNISEYLEQFSQYHGVTVTQSWYTIVWEDTISYTASRKYIPDGKITIDQQFTAKATSQKRIVGSLPAIKLGARPAYFNGIKRAANNVALLVQLMKRP